MPSSAWATYPSRRARVSVSAAVCPANSPMWPSMSSAVPSPDVTDRLVTTQEQLHEAFQHCRHRAIVFRVAARRLRVESHRAGAVFRFPRRLLAPATGHVPHGSTGPELDGARPQPGQL